MVSLDYSKQTQTTQIMSGKYKKHGGGKWILKNADKIQGQGRVKGEEKACLAPSKYEKTWNASRSPLGKIGE